MTMQNARLALTLGFILAGCGNSPTRPSLAAKAANSKDGAAEQIYKNQNASGDATAAGASENSDGSSSNGGTNNGSSTSSSGTDVSSMNAGTTSGASNTNSQTMTNTIDATAGIDCKTFKWETIKKPEEVACFASKEQAFAAIPDAVKPFWTLMRDSRSAQKSTLENPRLIMFAPDGSFLVGTATDPNARKDMEVAVFDYEKKEWQFAGINFTTTPPTVEKDLCKTCHAQSNTHPIWQPYGQWTGAFAQNNTLKDDEAAMLQKIANGSKDVPEILKNMKMNAANQYGSGKRLAPAVSKYAGENSQVLNYVIMQKSAQMAVGRILADGKATAADMVKMSADITCNGNQDTIRSLGYKIEELMTAALEGTDRASDNFNGKFSSRYYLAAELLYRAMQKDASLKAKLPDATKQFADDRYKYFLTQGLPEYNAFAASSKYGLRSLMSEFFAPNAGSGLGPTLGGSAHCNAAKSIQ